MIVVPISNEYNTWYYLYLYYYRYYIYRFNIHMGDRTFKLKAVSPTEGERWVNEIEKWKNYIILYM